MMDYMMFRPAIVLTRIQVEHTHSVLLVVLDAEWESMEVDGMELAPTPDVHEVPSRQFVLLNSQPWKRLCHVPVNGCRGIIELDCCFALSLCLSVLLTHIYNIPTPMHTYT